MLSEYETKNGPALERLIKKGVQVRTFPAEVLAVFQKYTQALHDENAKNNPFYAKLYKQWGDYRDSVRKWDEISSYTYQRYIFGDLAKRS